MVREHGSDRRVRRSTDLGVEQRPGPAKLLDEQRQRGVVRTRPGRSGRHRRLVPQLDERLRDGRALLRARATGLREPRDPVCERRTRTTSRGTGCQTLAAGPQELRRHDRSRAGEEPAPDPRTDVAQASLDRDPEHEREDHRTHRRAVGAAEEPDEAGRESDEQHRHDRGPHVHRQRGPQRDERGADEREHEVGPGPGPGCAAEVGEAEERERAERTEERGLTAPDDLEQEGEHEGCRDRDAYALLEREVARVRRKAHPGSEPVQPAAQVPASRATTGANASIWSSPITM